VSATLDLCEMPVAKLASQVLHSAETVVQTERSVLPRRLACAALGSYRFLKMTMQSLCVASAVQEVSRMPLKTAHVHSVPRGPTRIRTDQRYVELGPTVRLGLSQ
jgi:hypothetical protein